MTTLILKHANKNRLGAVEWGPNDFDVCVSDRCIGRIFMSAQASEGRPWFWTITAPRLIVIKLSLHIQAHGKGETETPRLFSARKAHAGGICVVEGSWHEADARNNSGCTSGSANSSRICARSSARL